jgi:hypothetical protein
LINVATVADAAVNNLVTSIAFDTAILAVLNHSKIHSAFVLLCAILNNEYVVTPFNTAVLAGNIVANANVFASGAAVGIGHMVVNSFNNPPPAAGVLVINAASTFNAHPITNINYYNTLGTGGKLINYYHQYYTILNQ